MPSKPGQGAALPRGATLGGDIQRALVAGDDDHTWTRDSQRSNLGAEWMSMVGLAINHPKCTLADSTPIFPNMVYQ